MAYPKGQDWRSEPEARKRSAVEVLPDLASSGRGDRSEGEKKRAGIAAGPPWAQRGRGGTPEPNARKSTFLTGAVQPVVILLLFRGRGCGLDDPPSQGLGRRESELLQAITEKLMMGSQYPGPLLTRHVR
jgi:hypothetical protein